MSEAKIDSLQLEISSSADGAVKSLEALSHTLNSLKSATKGGIGLTAVANQLKTLNTSLNGLTSANTAQLNSLTTALKSLSSVKVSASIGNQIKSISTALNELNIDESVAAKVNGLADALRPLSELGKSNLTSYISQIKKLPEVLTTLNGLDMGTLKSKLDELATALAPLGTQMGKISSGFSAMQSSMTKLAAKTDKVAQKNKKASKSYTELLSKVKMASAAIKTGVNTIGKFVTEANKYVENVNLFNVSMGKYATEAGKYVEQVNNLMGIDPSEWMRNQGVFMTLATGFGVTGERANTMSQQLTQLGYDISSFYNIPVEDAMQKLQSGVSGELEPLRRLGYDLSQAKLEATAMSLGIDKSVSSMTQAEKAQLRYHAIMTQVTTSHGDMARIITSPANQLRILTSNLTQCGRAIGSIFIPALQAVLPYLNAVLIVVKETATAFASLLGYELPEIGGTNMGTLVSGADDATDGLENAADAAKELKKYTMGFDELNIIDTSSGADTGAAGGDLNFELPTYDFLEGLEDNKVNDIVQNIKDLLSDNALVDWALDLDIDTKRIKKDFDKIVKDAVKIAKIIGKNINDVLSEIVLPLTEWVLEDVTPEVFSMLSEAMSAIPPVLEAISNGGLIAWNTIQPIVEWLKNTVMLVLQWINDFIVKIADVLVEKSPVIEDIIVGIGDIAIAIWNILQPIVDFIIAVLTPIVEEAIEMIGNTVGDCIDFLAGLVDFIAGVFSGDWERAWDGIVAMFSSVWDMVVEILSAVCDAIYRVIIEPVAGFFVDLWNGIVDVWNGAAKWFDDNFIQPICGFFTAMWDGISGFASDCWNGIVDVWTGVTTWFDDTLIKPISDAFSSLWNNIGGWASDCWDGIVSVFGSMADWFKTTFENAWKGIIDVFSVAGDIFNDIKDGVVNGFITIVNALIDGINKVIKIPFDGINSALKSLKKVDIFGLKPFDWIGTISVPQIPKIELKAEGGMVDTGQMFIAREAGPELVGTIGNKTAVVNNQQIIDGIATGVSVANSEQNHLLREQNSLLRALLEKETDLYLDGKRVADSVNKYARERGRVLVTGGAY